MMHIVQTSHKTFHAYFLKPLQKNIKTAYSTCTKCFLNIEMDCNQLSVDAGVICFV